MRRRESRALWVVRAAWGEGDGGKESLGSGQRTRGETVPSPTQPWPSPPGPQLHHPEEVSHQGPGSRRGLLSGITTYCSCLHLPPLCGDPPVLELGLGEGSARESPCGDHVTSLGRLFSSYK